MCVTNIPTPYRIHEFKCLFEHFAKKGVDFLVVFLANNEKGRNWNISKTDIDFPAIFPKGVQLYFKNIPFYINPGIIKHILKAKPRWLLLGGAWYQPTNLLAMFICKLFLNRKTNILIWSENPYHTYLEKGLGIWIKKLVFKAADGFVVPGEKAKRYIIKLIGKNVKILYLRNFVDEAKYFYIVMKLKQRMNEICRIWNINNDSIKILIPARLVEEKGILPFINAIRSIRGNFTILIAGDGYMRNRIKDLIEKGCDIDVKLLGYINEKEMLELYSISDLVVLPSKYDPHPLVTIEALWAGIPMLISDRVGSSEEVVKEGVNGWIFKYGDISDIQEKFRKAISLSKEELMNMGNMSKRIAIECFSSKKCIEEFVKGLNKL